MRIIEIGDCETARESKQKVEREREFEGFAGVIAAAVGGVGEEEVDVAPD